MADSRITGLAELKATFASMSDSMKKGAARRIAMAGGAVLRKEARIIAQSKGLRKTGAMINNIAIKRERFAPAGTEQYHLGVRHGRALGNGKKVVKYLALGKTGRVVTRRENDPWYWRFVHFGTKHIGATPFLERALDRKRNEAIAAMERQALKEVEKARK